VTVEIQDEDGRAVAAGQSGEICVRGDLVMKGYYAAPDKTAETVVGGWLHTGDIGHFDADGYLFITDRKKDMIISGGENIASSEVERVIYELPEVREVAVVGLPDQRWGEKPVAVVVLADNAALDLSSLIAHCRARLAGFKVPRELLIRYSLPRNPSGKVLKRVLRAELEAAR
jgi:fatty-acyl-CoA synthase